MPRLPFVLCLALLPLAPAPAQHREEPDRFDYRDVNLRHVNGRWVMYAGTRPLKDLGTTESEAREAVRLVTELRLNQHGTIGRPRPVIEYWLSDGQAPHSFTHGLRVVAFNPERLRVAEVQGQWCLCDGSQVMFGFGASSEDARQALAVLQRHGFNRVGYIGLPTPIMMYFLSSDDTESIRQPSAHRPPPPASPPPLALLLPSYQLQVPDQEQTDKEQAKTRVRFDWQQVELCSDGRDWKLMAGGRCLADFGSHDIEARDALEVVRYYRFSEQCRAGESPSACTYFLVNGQAPRGLMLGLRNLPFHAEALAVRQRGDEWFLCERGQTLLRAGGSYEEACQALEVIQHYKFDHACILGDPERPLLSFLACDN